MKLCLASLLFLLPRVAWGNGTKKPMKMMMPMKKTAATKKYSTKKKDCYLEIPLFEVVNPDLPFGSGIEGNAKWDTQIIHWDIVSDVTDIEGTKIGNTITACINAGDGIPETLFNTAAICTAQLTFNDPHGVGVGEIVVSGLLTPAGPGDVLESPIVGGSGDFFGAKGVLEGVQVLDENVPMGFYFQDKAMISLC